MTHDDDTHVTGPADHAASANHEISNVELQFMGHTDQEQELDATVAAESKAPGEYKERGMDKQDVAVAQTMDASDPPSTNMGEDE